jgi:thiol:disulfide interchange protein
MPTINTILLASLFLLATTSIWADTPTTEDGPQWQRLTPELVQRARQENRLLLVDLAAEWCQFCKKMDRSTWPDPKVLESIDKYYIPVRIQDEDQPELAEKYRQYGRPAFFVLNGNGEEVMRKRGYLEARFMHWMLEGIAQEAGL